MVVMLSLSDVGPKPPPCNVEGKGCTSCVSLAGQSDGGCEAFALDAGLKLSDCSDRSGSQLTSYYCPAGVTLSHGSCGCASAPLGAALLVLALIGARRARGRAGRS